MTSQNGEDTCQQRNCIDPTLGLAGLADRDSAFIVMKFQGACNYKIHHACYLMHYTLQSAYKKFINAFTCEHLPTLPPRYSFIQLSQLGRQWRERNCPIIETVAKGIRGLA